MMNRGPQTNHLWNAIASYFVNQYYNYIYKAAKGNKYGSLTEAYQQTVQNYIIGIKNVEEVYRKLSTDLHKHITNSSRFASLMYGEFIDRTIASFVPADYYEMLHKHQKDEIFSSVINDLVSSLGTFCLNPQMLKKIIDEHDHSREITQNIIYREGLSCLNLKKESLIQNFVRNIGQTKDMVPATLVNQYIEQVEQLTMENNNLKSELSDLENKFCEAEEEFEEKEKGFRKVINYLKKVNITVSRNQRPTAPSPPVASVTKTTVHQPSYVASVTQTEVAPPPPVYLTAENLQKHTSRPENAPISLMEDESESSGEVPIVGGNVRKSLAQKTNPSLDSGKKTLLDNIDGLLLVDNISE